MTKRSSVALVALCHVLLSLAGPTAGAREPEAWTCTIQLAAGGTGSLQFTRTASGIQGDLTQAVGQASTPIKGAWNRELIRFSRTLSDSTEQPFIGIAVSPDDHTMKMAGRFGSTFDDVWSAACSRGDENPGTGAGTPAGATETSGMPGPSLSIRIDPYKPTTLTPVKFIARASHSSGVREVTIHVNGQAVRTCSVPSCEFTGGPYPAGTIRWRVTATAQNGAVQPGDEREVTIAGSSPGTACSISGAASGPHAELAKSTVLLLYGPDSSTVVRARQPFGSGTFSFTNLPNGRYILSADIRGDTAVRVVPRRVEIVCSGAAVAGVNFAFE
jgi:hypothetical protein